MATDVITRNSLQGQLLERPARIEGLLKQLQAELDDYAADIVKAGRIAFHRGAARNREFTDAFELQGALSLDKLHAIVARRLAEMGHVGIVQRPQMPASVGDDWVASFEKFIRRYVHDE